MRQPDLSAHPQAGPEIYEDDVAHAALLGGGQASVIETSHKNLW